MTKLSEFNPQRDKKVHSNRRDFLSLAWKGLLSIGGLLTIGGLLRYLGYQTDPAPPTIFDLGPASELPESARTIIPEAQAILTHGSRGWQAFSLVCTHLGCLVEASAQGYQCPCHRSRFTADGSLANGPAEKPLRVLRVEVTENGNLVLHTD